MLPTRKCLWRRVHSLYLNKSENHVYASGNCSSTLTLRICQWNQPKSVSYFGMIPGRNTCRNMFSWRGLRLNTELSNSLYLENIWKYIQNENLLNTQPDYVARDLRSLSSSDTFDSFCDSHCGRGRGAHPLGNLTKMLSLTRHYEIGIWHELVQDERETYACSNFKLEQIV